MPAVLYETRGHIAYITLNRPQVLNAVNRELSLGLTGAVQEINRDGEVWVAIVTGAGRSWCAGDDLQEALRALKARRPRRRRRATSGAPPPARPIGFLTGSLVPSFWDSTKPIVAAVNGFALGGGLELLLSCDIRVASEQASFGAPEPRLNLLHGTGAWLLPRLIPTAWALELLLTGERVSAQEAYRMGLVNRVVPHDQLMPAAEEIARKVCLNGPLAISRTRELVYSGLDGPFSEHLGRYAAVWQLLLATEDYREGLTAFMEKRAPQFKGR